jgi:hemerythrin-like domain-containing protein
MNHPAHDPCASAALDPRTLPPEHVVRTMMEEHRQVLAQLLRLEKLVNAGAPSEGDPVDRKRLEEMRGIGTYLVGIEPHHQREEQVLFPALRDRGLEGPPTVMESEHVELRTLTHAVVEQSSRLLAEGPGDWVKLRQAAQTLVSVLREHIYKEDTILYPMSLRLIHDEADWEELKRRCDEVGY